MSSIPSILPRDLTDPTPLLALSGSLCSLPTWGTPSQSSACCMASRAFCTGWLGSQASQSGQRPGEMVEGSDDEGQAVSQDTEHLLHQHPPRPWVYTPFPHSPRPLTSQVPADLTARQLGGPSLFRRTTALPSTNNEAFLPQLTQPGTSPASRPPACPGPAPTLNTKPQGSTPLADLPPLPSCLRGGQSPSHECL